MSDAPQGGEGWSECDLHSSGLWDVHLVGLPKRRQLGGLGRSVRRCGVSSLQEPRMGKDARARVT